MKGNNKVRTMRSGLALILCVFSLLAGCGGGDGGTTPPPVSNNPPPPTPPPPPAPVIGAAGGTVTEASGASVIVPAGALTTNTTIRIARDSTGAPAIPADLTSAGSTYVITPHGGEFAEGVEVQLPLPNVTLTPYQEFKIAKAQPGGPWVVLEDTVVNEASLSAKVDSFSYFVVVTVTYLIPIAQLPPLQMSSSLACTGGRCTGLIGGTTATYTVTGNGGQAPTHCLDPSYSIGTTSNGSSVNWQVSGTPIPPTGGTVTRTLSPFPGSANYKFIVARKCSVGALYGEL